MPELIQERPQLIPNLDVTKEIGRVKDVAVTHTVTPASLWVRFTDEKHESYHEKLQSLLTKYYENFEMAKDEEHDDLMEEHNDLKTALDYCNKNEKFLEILRKYYGDYGRWNAVVNINGLKRVEILEFLEFQRQPCAVVDCLDTGEKFIVNGLDLMPLHSSLRSIPKLAVNCYLYGIRPRNAGWSRLSVKVFQNMMRNNAFKIFIPLEALEKNTGVYPVKMIVVCEDTLIDLSKVMIRLGDAQLKSDDEDDQEDFSNWDPMKAAYESEYNAYNIDVDDPGVRIYGYASEDGLKICPQFGRTGKCVKGNSCRKEHIRIDPNKFTNIPQLIYTEPFDTLDDLEYNHQYAVKGAKIHEQFIFLTLDTDLKKHSYAAIKLFENMGKTETVYKYEHLTVPPGLGELLIVRTGHPNKGWHRAKCVRSEQTDDTYLCYLVDYGIMVELPITDMREMEGWCLKTPFLARRVEFKGIRFTDEKFDLLAMGGKWTAELVGREGLDVVDLVNEDGVSVAEFLLDKGIGKPWVAQFCRDDEFIPG